MSETVTLPMPLVQTMGEYLAGRPYREVAVMLTALAEAVQPKPAPQPDPIEG